MSNASVYITTQSALLHVLPLHPELRHLMQCASLWSFDTGWEQSDNVYSGTFDRDA